MQLIRQPATQQQQAGPSLRRTAALHGTCDAGSGGSGVCRGARGAQMAAPNSGHKPGEVSGGELAAKTQRA